MSQPRAPEWMQSKLAERYPPRGAGLCQTAAPPRGATSPHPPAVAPRPDPTRPGTTLAHTYVPDRSRPRRPSNSASPRRVAASTTRSDG